MHTIYLRGESPQNHNAIIMRAFHNGETWVENPLLMATGLFFPKPSIELENKMKFEIKKIKTFSPLLSDSFITHLISTEGFWGEPLQGLKRQVEFQKMEGIWNITNKTLLLNANPVTDTLIIPRNLVTEISKKIFFYAKCFMMENHSFKN